MWLLDVPLPMPYFLPGCPPTGISKFMYGGSLAEEWACCCTFLLLACPWLELCPGARRKPIPMASYSASGLSDISTLTTPRLPNRSIILVVLKAGCSKLHLFIEKAFKHILYKTSFFELTIRITRGTCLSVVLVAGWAGRGGHN